jgi:Tol biopolymer transport system component
MPRVPDLATWPRWSPDGTLIAYVASPDFLPTQVWVIRPDGRGNRLLGRGTLISSPPTWSADSKSLAYANAAPGDILVVRRDGTGSFNLSQSKDVIDGPKWAPVGSAIAYAAGITCPVSVETPTCAFIQVVVHRTTNSARELIDQTPDASRACCSHGAFIWSPDGTRIAFQKRNNAGNGGMYVKTLDEPGLVLVLPGNAEPLDWTD